MDYINYTYFPLCAYRTSHVCHLWKKTLSDYKTLVECAFREQLQQQKPWKNTNYSKYISSAIKHPDVSWGNGIVPVWSPAQMALDHSSLLQYTHPANSTQTFSSRGLVNYTSPENAWNWIWRLDPGLHYKLFWKEKIQTTPVESLWVQTE